MDVRDPPAYPAHDLLDPAPRSIVGAAMTPAPTGSRLGRVLADVHLVAALGELLDDRPGGAQIAAVPRQVPNHAVARDEPVNVVVRPVLAGTLAEDAARDL